MKKYVKILLCGLLMFTFMTGCAKGNDKPASVGEKMAEEFKDCSSGKTALEIAETLATSSTLPFSGAAIEVEEGFLSGFDNFEVTGFKEGAMFAPMMGTIPFVGYIFLLDDGADVDAFMKTLKDNANLRWNICTEAEEMTVEKEGNVVFFLMSPKAFEEQ